MKRMKQPIEPNDRQTSDCLALPTLRAHLAKVEAFVRRRALGDIMMESQTREVARRERTRKDLRRCDR